MHNIGYIFVHIRRAGRYSETAKKAQQSRRAAFVTNRVSESRYCYTTQRNATLVCVLSNISSAVIFCMYVSLNVFGDRYIGAGATDRHENLQDGKSHIRTKLLSIWWRYL